VDEGAEPAGSRQHNISHNAIILECRRARHQVIDKSSSSHHYVITEEHYGFRWRG